MLGDLPTPSFFVFRLPFGSSFLSGSFKYWDYLQAEYKALFFLFYHLSESDLIHTHNFN